MTEGLRQYALNIYINTDFNNDSANDFFSTFCPGQKIFSLVNTENGGIDFFSDQAFERFYDYKEFLIDLFNTDPQKYKNIHKGTPFFFMAWISYYMQNYDQALFYLDAAIEEDSKNGIGKWEDFPAGKFLLLKMEGHSATDVVEKIIKILKDQFARFNSLINDDLYNIGNFVDTFIKPIAQEKINRTLISSLYTFFLEYPLHLQLLDLRSNEGGTIYPFIKHLFNGGLIFETLLRTNYSKNEKGEVFSSIGGIFKSKSFNNIFGEIDSIKVRTISEILDQISDQELSTAFKITAMIRNISGHDLIRYDIFNEKENYIKLYEQEVNAILYFIKTDYFT